jgi:hypothetical protein
MKFVLFNGSEQLLDEVYLHTIGVHDRSFSCFISNRLPENQTRHLSLIKIIYITPENCS